MSSGRLRLHAWYYTAETGDVLTAVPGRRTFKPLWPDRSTAPHTPVRGGLLPGGLALSGSAGA